MPEYLTEAVVLDKKESGETDTLLFLYTKDLGRVSAKVRSGRKITSKLASHLEPLNFVRVRLVEKKGFHVVDALAPKQKGKTKAYGSVENLSKALNLLQFIKDASFDLQPDPVFWREIKKVLSRDLYGLSSSADKSGQNKKTDEKSIYRNLLKILGFDPKFADCYNCRGKPVGCFYKKDQIFFCEKCSSKIPKDELILI